MDFLLLSRAEVERYLLGRCIAVAVCYCYHAFTQLLPSSVYSRYNTYICKLVVLLRVSECHITHWLPRYTL
jgi:hypothetical protein